MTSVIRVDRLGKRYAIDAASEQVKYRTLRETLVGLAKAPRRRWRRGSSRRRDDFWALRNVDFEIAAGEVVGIIGSNGAGKSTLLKILSRITAPTTGQVAIRGRVGSLLEVGTGFHPELTGRENIQLNGAILGMTRREIARKFDAIVAFSEVERFLETPVKRYSSGMYVRLAFAVAAHLEPEIFIVDEVLAVGDAAFQKKCLGKMDDVAHQGRTVLFVSHNMAAVNHLCRKAIWMDHGRIRQIGLTEPVVQEYLAGETRQPAHATWTYPGDAPGDDRVRLTAARVVQHGATAGIVDINSPAAIELEFVVLRDVRNLVSGVHLYDATGTCLFASSDWRPNEMRPGHYRKRVALPPQLLAEGSTKVHARLVFHAPDIPSAMVPDAVAFEAVDCGHPLAVRGRYMGRWPGVVRVRLDWDKAEPLPPPAAAKSAVETVG